MSDHPQMGSIYSINSLFESTRKDHIDFQKPCARNMTPVLLKQGLLSPLHSNTLEYEIRKAEREKSSFLILGLFPTSKFTEPWPMLSYNVSLQVEI
jgi:hypothetical protein